MENYIQDIELINKYLNKTLSEKEVQGFENRLKTDEAFNSLYNEHLLFLEGLKRHELKSNIIKAKQSYIRSKWFKYLGFTSGLIILIVFVFIYINFNKLKTEKPNPIQNEINNSVTTLDSIVSNNIIEEIVFEDTIKTEQPKIKEAIPENVVKTKKGIVKIPKKSSQTFTINHKKDATIVCKEGTKLTIKANSFVDKNNKIITGKVDLKVIEYYNLSDILLANLSTQSNGKLLETGGMLNLQAYRENEPLNLKQNSNIEILFPTKKKNMQLFSGEWRNGLLIGISLALMKMNRL